MPISVIPIYVSDYVFKNTCLFLSLICGLSLLVQGVLVFGFSVGSLLFWREVSLYSSCINKYKSKWFPKTMCSVHKICNQLLGVAKWEKKCLYWNNTPLTGAYLCCKIEPNWLLIINLNWYHTIDYMSYSLNLN